VNGATAASGIAETSGVWGTSTVRAERFVLVDLRRAGTAATAPVDTTIDFSETLFLGILSVFDFLTSGVGYF
jgi:hypothetical protein